MFNEILEENQNESSCYRDELDKNLAEPLVTFGRSNGLQWWSENLSRFPTLAQIAQKYLYAPPTSVPSERLFSGAGNVCDDRRSRLAPRNAELLLFIKNNIDDRPNKITLFTTYLCNPVPPSFNYIKI